MEKLRNMLWSLASTLGHEGKYSNLHNYIVLLNIFYLISSYLSRLWRDRSSLYHEPSFAIVLLSDRFCVCTLQNSKQVIRIYIIMVWNYKYLCTLNMSIKQTRGCGFKVALPKLRSVGHRDIITYIFTPSRNHESWSMITLDHLT